LTQEGMSHDVSVIFSIFISYHDWPY
jgi:hypothetical protein